jgi:hypothetical protein
MHSNGNGKSSMTLEHEAEQSRAQLAATLDELRGSMSPGQVVDQFLSYAKQTGGADFMRNLGDQVRANPLPVALIGSGVAWLMMSGRGSSGAYGGSPNYSGSAYPRSQDSTGTAGGLKQTVANVSGAARQARDMAAGMSSATGDAVAQAASGVRDGMDSARGMVSSATSMASSVGSQVAEGLSAASDTVSNVGGSVMGAGRRVAHDGYAGLAGLTNLFREQPLLLAAFGIAVGAALGTTLPKTRAEDEYLGPMSDAVKDQARDIASDQFEHAKEAAVSAFDSVKGEAEKQGLTAGSVDEAIDKAGAVAATALKSAEQQGAKLTESLNKDAKELAGKNPVQGDGAETKIGAGTAGEDHGSKARSGTFSVGSSSGDSSDSGKPPQARHPG